MKYLEGRKLFLFDMVNIYLKSLDQMDGDSFNCKIVIENVNRFLSSIPRNFTEIIFRIVYRHTTELNLNFIGSGRTIGIGHIRNIYKGVIGDYRVRDILKSLDDSMSRIISDVNFDVRNYLKVVDLIEELDLVCVFEIYSYLLGEDVDSVLSFILNKFVESLYLGNDRGVDISDRVLSCIESKIKLFRKLYDDEDVHLVSKNQECIIYKINDVLKMVYV